MSEFLDIFVGTDRSQLLAVAVLEHSIKRHTLQPVRLCPLIDLQLPEPRDIRNGSRTGFSFARFAIPELMGFQGKALYLDADMLVFADIDALWRLPFGAAKVIIQAAPGPQARRKRSGAPRKRQCSVMMIDCARTGWDVNAIVAGLDGAYDYDQLLGDLCILRDDEIAEAIPFQWNSLEHYDDATRLLHYTDMPTQPWVSPFNPLGRPWLDELLMMLENGRLSWRSIEDEIGLGYFRPSLIEELRGLPTAPRWSEAYAEPFGEIDRQAGFVKHGAVFRRKKERDKAIRDLNAQLQAAPQEEPAAEPAA